MIKKTIIFFTASFATALVIHASEEVSITERSLDSWTARLEVATEKKTSPLNARVTISPKNPLPGLVRLVQFLKTKRDDALTFEEIGITRPIQNCKNSYAQFILALYALTGEFQTPTPDVLTSWWPSEVKTNPEHPLTLIKNCALIENMPEACYFIIKLSEVLDDKKIDAWLLEPDKTHCLDILKEANLRIRDKSHLEAQWYSEQSDLESHYLLKYKNLREEMDFLFSGE